MTESERDELRRTMRRLRICVLIPTYNNAGTLHRVVSDTLSMGADVIVVNDGSTDSTQAILDSFGDRITQVSYSRNRGKGHALKEGFRKALEAGYDYAVTLDSDGQHYPSDLPGFIEAVGCHPGSLIVGERDLSGVDINGKSSFANKFSNFWFCVQTGRRLRDTQTGYRAYPLKRLYGLNLLTSRYEAELELLVFAAWNGVKIIGIPINVYYPPQAERVSHFRPALDFTRISILNTVLCVGAIVYGLPARLAGTVRERRLFNREVRMMTRRKGEKRDAAVTLGRLARSIYGLAFFLTMSLGIYTPGLTLYFKTGKVTEEKRLRLHRMLQGLSRYIATHLPGCGSRIINAAGETFQRPALIVCNHQSHLDLPMLMSVHPKLIFLTNDWVWNSRYFGKIIRYAEYLPVSAGIENILPRLHDLRDRGYSIVVFPEGTRSADCSVLRFHQGAFRLARELNLDIVPMVLHGAGFFLPKKDFMFRRGEITLKILPRVKEEELTEMTTLKQASMFRRMIRSEHDRIAFEKETTAYFEALVSYKYAWRGWRTVSRSKRDLAWIRRHRELIDGNRGYRTVSIINSGIGTFALLFALVNRESEVYAFESSLADHRTASETPGLPPNLHFRHAVLEKDMNPEGIDFDLHIDLNHESSTKPTCQ